MVHCNIIFYHLGNWSFVQLGWVQSDASSRLTSPRLVHSSGSKVFRKEKTVFRCERKALVHTFILIYFNNGVRVNFCSQVNDTGSQNSGVTLKGISMMDEDGVKNRE